MSEIIQSISFQENRVSWIQASVNAKKININRVAESLLPFVINYDNIRKPSIALQIANHLNTLASSHDISLNNVRFLLPAKFMIVKKILLDRFISKEQVKKIVKAEYNQILTESSDAYIIYIPQYSKEVNNLNEILTVALKRDLFNFFNKIAEEANFNLTRISVNCFSVSSLLKSLFPQIIGQTLLVNFTERGFELIICDEKYFLTFLYKPYAKSLESIEQLDDPEILSSLSDVLEEIQSPSSIDRSLFSISQIYFYGSYFKPEWLDIAETQLSIPVHILNPIQSKEWRVITDDPDFDPNTVYRYIEPLSNLL